MITLRVEAVLEIDTEASTVCIVDSTEPLPSTRPVTEDPREYTRAVSMLLDGATFERIER